MPRTISSLGSVALLVSSVTGPSLVVIPLLYQQAGWFTPLLAFAVIGFLSGTASLLVVEAMSSIQGNEDFQASIEFTTIAHLFLGKRWHMAVQVVVYLALQTLVIASLLESFQAMDALLVAVAHKTCAVSFTHGWVCINQITPNTSSAFSGYILGSFGTLITICLILPLSLIHLVDNIIFQVTSFIVLLIITVVWIVIFALRGLNNYIPVVGSNQSTVVGFVLSNFAFVTTIPAWVNNTHPSVNIRRVVWVSIVISCLIYIPIGWMGGAAFVLPNNTTVLQVLAADRGRGALSTIARVSTYIFPLAVLISSIPVFTIVIRYNLLRGNICSYKMAVFLSAILPWVVAIPFQTDGGVTTILNWASLIFTSPANLLIPFILFIVSTRNVASAILDPKIAPERSETPIARTEPERSASVLDNIPVLVITSSADESPDDADNTKTLDSRGEVERPALDTLPVPVMARVLAPSRHRYYGQETSSDVEECPRHATGTEEGHHHHQRMLRPLSGSHSVTRSPSPGMDEFLLLGPAEADSHSHTARSVRARSPRWSIGTTGSSEASDYGAHPSLPTGNGEIRISVSTPSTVVGDDVPVFRAFPCLSPTSFIRPTRIGAAGFLVASAIVVTAIVYNIVETVAAGGSG